MAQLVEQRIRNAQVVRSSRTSSSIKRPVTCMVTGLFMASLKQIWTAIRQ